MSAECSKCGMDIVYPDGLWPVGECPRCSRDELIAILEREIAKPITDEEFAVLAKLEADSMLRLPSIQLLPARGDHDGR